MFSAAPSGPIDDDGLHPSQVPARYRVDGPERRLMAAVLQQAIEDFHSLLLSDGRHMKGYSLTNPPTPTELARLDEFGKDLCAWFWSSQSETIRDFEVICEVLDLDAQAIRGQLMRWRADRQERRWARGPRAA